MMQRILYQRNLFTFIHRYPNHCAREVLKKELIELIAAYKDMKLPVQGLEDEKIEHIYVMDELAE